MTKLQAAPAEAGPKCPWCDGPVQETDEFCSSCETALEVIALPAFVCVCGVGRPVRVAEPCKTCTAAQERGELAECGWCGDLSAPSTACRRCGRALS